MSDLDQMVAEIRHAAYYFGVIMSDDRDWDPITIENVKCVHESDGGALRVVVDGESHWIPKKLVNDDSEVYKVGTDGDLIIPTWLAEEKGLA